MQCWVFIPQLYATTSVLPSKKVSEGRWCRNNNIITGYTSNKVMSTLARRDTAKNVQKMDFFGQSSIWKSVKPTEGNYCSWKSEQSHVRYYSGGPIQV